MNFRRGTIFFSQNFFLCLKKERNYSVCNVPLDINCYVTNFAFFFALLQARRNWETYEKSYFHNFLRIPPAQDG